ncbi:hypothetical protein [Rhizobium azibense]|uniref:GxxExxY protein n=1 Tax=Rhizobium azibense TaxID=1136135 RepID=A0A4V2VDU6_9HYPH|nr:hypothetical protein [Rhizobium azibense]TCU34075.1 hypothetical protein EV129_11358 [Rhizobium azibense]
MSEVQDIIRLLQSRRFSLTNEKKLQAEIEVELTAFGIEHEREYRLGAGSIIDFLVKDSIGAEIKLKGSKLNIFRQVERYTGFDEIKRLILVTNVPMGMPPLVNGKPVYVVNLAKAWL